MNKKILFLCAAGFLLFQALPVLAASTISLSVSPAPTAYEFNGKYYYIVDGNSSSMNSGDRVCASMGQTCVGYTANTTAICQNIHPTASVTTTVNGNSAGFYCNGKPQGYAACSAAINNCQICPACGTVSCSDQIGDQYAQMYVECSGSPAGNVVVVSNLATASAVKTSTQPSDQSGSWLSGFLQYLHNLWFSLGWITTSGTPTGANHPAATPSPQGGLLPAQICTNGGQCKSGNCVEDSQGVYRCSCSPLGSDYSSCH